MYVCVSGWGEEWVGEESVGEWGEEPRASFIKPIATVHKSLSR